MSRMSFSQWRRQSAMNCLDSGVGPAPNPDHAGRARALVNEWIRHTGVLGTMTFTSRKASILPARSDLLVIFACALLVLPGGLGSRTLTPRVNDKGVDRDAINRLFFVSISRHFDGMRQQYGDVLHTLAANLAELTKELADQIHANAKVGTIKARLAKWAMRSALAAGADIAAIAIVTGVPNT